MRTNRYGEIISTPSMLGELKWLRSLLMVLGYIATFIFQVEFTVPGYSLDYNQGLNALSISIVIMAFIYAHIYKAIGNNVGSFVEIILVFICVNAFGYFLNGYIFKYIYILVHNIFVIMT